MKDNIFIKTLKLGFDNPKGISLNEIVQKLDIDFSNISYKTNFIKWFYANFFNKNAESRVVGDKTSPNTAFGITEYNISLFEEINNQKSFIKGDAVNKYIDYLELERTRKASRKAVWVSAISFIIAISAIIIPIKFDKTPQPPFEVNVINKQEKDTIIETLDEEAGNDIRTVTEREY